MIVVALNPVGELFEGKASASHGKIEELRDETSGNGDLLPSLASVAQGKLLREVVEVSSGGQVQNLPKNETMTDDWIGWIILALIL